MRFFTPTDVYLEENCVANHKKELLACGSKAFIVTGKNSSRINGSLSDVTSVLDEADVPYRIFNDIEENPSVETVAKAAAIGKEFQADFVIGIGGGSPLDAAKAIALLMANPEENEDCFYQPKDLKNLPVVAVPTTCGTGSEVTPNAVLTRHAQKTKKSISYRIFPELALVDGKYLSFASRKLLIHTAVDALAHCLESRLHKNSNCYNRMFSEYGLRLWGETVPALLSDEQASPDAKTCEKLMLISTVAGMAIAQTGTSLPHALSYEITYNHGTAHGMACGLFLASYLEDYASHDKEETEQVLTLLGFSSLEAFRSCISSLIGTVSISEAELNLYADNVMNNPSKLSTYPFAIDREGIAAILRNSLEVKGE
ncbi:MAG: iron-containing alcohol dehydrogenase family protein [Eubacteriales bacterium]|nr:iron-containing alcohol dehydrogenase family protein [Eubacteriales bacterium]